MADRSLPRFLRALSSRNYRLFFAGQCISLIGTWMTQTASLWLAYHLERSPTLLGLVGFASQAPIFFLGPLAGVWIDRAERRHLLLGTQFLSMLQSAALAVCALTGRINIWGLVWLSFVQGLINAVDFPCRQSFVIQLVDQREDLTNAIALNSSMFNLARLFGPALAGLVIAATSAGVCYVVDAVSYVAVLLSLLAIRPRAVVVAPLGAIAPPGRALGALREGWTYAFGFAPIRAVIALVAVVALTGFAAPVLMPVFAKDIFHGDARTLGWLMSATGVGALGGAIYLSTRGGVRGLGDVVTFGGCAMAIGLIGCGLCRTVHPALVFLGMVGAGGVLLMASCNTILQSLVDEDKRGRVMSLFTMAFTGTAPIGNLIVGAVAGTWFGAQRTLEVCGACCFVAAVIFYRQLPELRRLAAPVLERLETRVAPVG